MARLFGPTRAEQSMMRNVLIKSILTALFLIGAAAAQTQTPAETPAVEPAPETAPAEAAESAIPVDWAARAREAFAAGFKESCAANCPETLLEKHKPDVYEFRFHYSQYALKLPQYRAIAIPRLWRPESCE
jgi:hypothetical protein